jgi:hypothetical protein
MLMAEQEAKAAEVDEAVMAARAALERLAETAEGTERMAAAALMGVLARAEALR